MGLACSWAKSRGNELLLGDDGPGVERDWGSGKGEDGQSWAEMGRDGNMRKRKKNCKD